MRKNSRGFTLVELSAGSRRKANGFTLVELLVVIGIIAVLIGILMPTLSGVRKSAARVTCRAQLADIGKMFQMYLNDSKGKLPYVNTFPSRNPPLNAYPSIIEVFRPYHHNATNVFHCPSDAIRMIDPLAAPGFATYFEREGSSYQYSPNLAVNFGGKELNDTNAYKNKKQNQLWLFIDYEPFHASFDPNNPPPSGSYPLGAANFLFADMHVGDLAAE